MTGSATAGGGRRGGYTAGVRALALLFALLVPAGQVLAALHLHCALEHPLGRTTPHAAGPELSQLHGYGQGHGHGHEQVHERQREQAHDHEHQHPHEHPHEHEPAAAADVGGDHSTAHPEIASGYVEHADGSGIATLFDEHHHHDDATGSHSCCCIGGAAGAIACTDGRIGVDVHAQRFVLPVPSGAYDSPFHEPPPRPQWRLHAPA